MIQTPAQGGPFFFSIVIPARNEMQDIARTLDACINIDYEPKEIIVVDDSSDQTPEIVAQYASRGVRLIHRPPLKTASCCSARNDGMKNANGDIIVLMNADDVPRRDFLKRLAQHYRDDADWLVVRSRALNPRSIWAEYIYAYELASWAGKVYDPYWSEGISFRKTLAEAVGFIPGDFPVRFCRDNMLGRRLTAAGYKKHADETIPMEHVVPETFEAFWGNRAYRGAHSAPSYYYFSRPSLWIALFREIAKAIRAVILTILILPLVWRAYKLSRHIGGISKIPAMMLVGLVEDAATVVGNLKGWKRLAAAVRPEPAPAVHA